jgi:hypothetical protein
MTNYLSNIPDVLLLSIVNFIDDCTYLNNFLLINRKTGKMKMEKELVNEYNLYKLMCMQIQKEYKFTNILLCNSLKSEVQFSTNMIEYLKHIRISDFRNTINNIYQLKKLKSFDLGLKCYNIFVNRRLYTFPLPIEKIIDIGCKVVANFICNISCNFAEIASFYELNYDVLKNKYERLQINKCLPCEIKEMNNKHYFLPYMSESGIKTINIYNHLADTKISETSSLFIIHPDKESNSKEDLITQLNIILTVFDNINKYIISCSAKNTNTRELINLVAYGAQDQYLINNQNISFFDY